MNRPQDPQRLHSVEERRSVMGRPRVYPASCANERCGWFGNGETLVARATVDRPLSPEQLALRRETLRRWVMEAAVEDRSRAGHRPTRPRPAGPAAGGVADEKPKLEIRRVFDDNGVRDAREV